MRGQAAKLSGAATPNKHQQRSEATRGKLLSAALRVFARDGFEASRIEDIAAEAGHSRGAFYANFDTKENLFLALLEQQAMKRIAQLQAAVMDLSSRRQQLDGFRKFYVSRSADLQWTMVTLEFKLYALRHSKQRARLAAAHQRIRESLHLQVTSKINTRFKSKCFDENMTKVLLDVLLTGLVLEHSYDPKRISADEMTNALGRIFDVLTAE